MSDWLLLATAQAEHYVERAANSGVPIEPLDPETHGIGVRVLTTDRCHVDLVRMIFNWRICETDLGAGLSYGRYWCFAGTGYETFDRALVEALRYGGRAGDQPAGFIKSWEADRA